VDLYNKNSLKVYRQIYYSNKVKNSVDIVLSLNGIPVATMELKNQFTGQATGNALKQYSQTRDNREILFAFKKRKKSLFFPGITNWMPCGRSAVIFWRPVSVTII
jgi:type I restriction enzyme R subunit